MSNKKQSVYLTPEGLKKVQDELFYLIRTRRPEVAGLIAEAKAEGDLRENAGYDEAKTQQGFLEGRIRELENILKHSKIIEETTAPANAVAIGRTVVVQEVGTSFEETYTIVGSMEAAPLDGRISNESPIGKALLGRRVGEEVTVETPGGVLPFEIVRIE